MTVIVDSGALIAFERGDRSVAALLEAARRRGEAVETSSGCVAQSWRIGGPRQALLARALHGVDERPLDADSSKAIGLLCGRAGTSDVIDAHIAVLACRGDVVVTSDEGDILVLLTAAKTVATIVGC
jgi:hypothetical protein